MLFGLHFGVPSKNIGFTIKTNNQSNLVVTKMTGVDQSALAFPNLDINISNSAFIPQFNGVTPAVPFFAIHRVIGIGGGGGGGGSKGFYPMENGEGGRAGAAVDKMCIFTKPLKGTTGVSNDILLYGGNAGASGSSATAGGNGRAYLAPLLTIDGTGLNSYSSGGRAWTSPANNGMDTNGEVNGFWGRYNGEGGAGAPANGTSGAGYHGSLLVLGLIS